MLLERQVTLAIGRVVKRDTAVVKVTTDDGLVEWAESHHGRAHLAIATLVNSTLRQLALSTYASNVKGGWQRIYKFQLGSHGMGCHGPQDDRLWLWDRASAIRQLKSSSRRAMGSRSTRTSFAAIPACPAPTMSEATSNAKELTL
jgi:hypothetical protein